MFFLIREGEGEGDIREEQGAQAVTADDLFARPVRYGKRDVSATDPADLCTLTGRIQQALKRMCRTFCFYCFPCNVPWPLVKLPFT